MYGNGEHSFLIDTLSRIGFGICGVALGIMLLKALFSDGPEVTTRPAGTVKSLQLHDTTFATTTTIETTEGWYQVEGAVSASKGDAVRIDTKGDARSACVASDDKETCYRFQ